MYIFEKLRSHKNTNKTITNSYSSITQKERLLIFYVCFQSFVKNSRAWCFYKFKYLNASKQKKDILVIGSLKYRKNVWRQSPKVGKSKGAQTVGNTAKLWHKNSLTRCCRWSYHFGPSGTPSSGLPLWQIQPWVIIQLFLSLDVTPSRFIVRSNGLGHTPAVRVEERGYSWPPCRCKTPSSKKTHKAGECQLLSCFVLGFKPCLLWTTLWCGGWDSVNQVSPWPAAPCIDPAGGGL